MRVLSFDESSGTLLVEVPGFPNYEVFDVPVETFKEWQRSASPDGFFNEFIWGNNFEHDSHWPNLDALLEYMGEHMTFDSPTTVQTRQGDGDTPLHTACVWGDLSAIDLLIAGGADINAKGDLSTTPIYNAVSFRRVRSIERLLRAGATIDDKNQLYSTARELAYERNEEKIIKLFANVA